MYEITVLNKETDPKKVQWLELLDNKMNTIDSDLEPSKYMQLQNWSTRDPEVQRCVGHVDYGLGECF
jgi:hypothetical protein